MRDEMAAHYLEYEKLVAGKKPHRTRENSTIVH